MCMYTKRRGRVSVESRVCLCDEAPSQFFSPLGQAYVEADKLKPGKRWVYDVIMHGKERSYELLRTLDYVVLPDNGTGCVADVESKDRARQADGCVSYPVTRRSAGGGRGVDPRCLRDYRHDLHLLAITIDPSLRCLRDLTGAHVAMLEALQASCVKVAQEMFGVDERHVLVFANYPPSVYQLHFHVCAPFRRVSSYDAFRVHSLTTIISNLRMNGSYYQLVCLRVPVLSGSELCTAVGMGSSTTPRQLAPGGSARECEADERGNGEAQPGKVGVPSCI